MTRPSWFHKNDEVDLSNDEHAIYHQGGKPIVAHLDFGSKSSKFTILPSGKLEKIKHIIIVDDVSFIIPFFASFMFRSPRDQDIKKLRPTTFSIVEDPKTRLAAIKLNGKDRLVTSKYLIKMMVYRMNEICRTQYNGTLRSLSVSIPCPFSATQRSNLMDCLSNGGVHDITFFESISLLAARFAKLNVEKQRILIGNWTNSHFEVGVAVVDSTKVDVISKAGKASIGLSVLKNGISTLIASKWYDKPILDVTDEEIQPYFKYVKDILLTLLNDEECTTNIDGKDITITREEVEAECGHPFAAIESLTNQLLTKNKGVRSSCFLMRGSATNSKVFNDVGEKNGILSQVSLRDDQTLLERVADGSLVVNKRLAMTISSNAIYDRVCPMFKVGAELPLAYKLNLKAVSDNQLNHYECFCEGERLRFSANSLIGSKTINIQQSKRVRAGQIDLCALYTIDENGIFRAQYHYPGDDNVIDDYEAKIVNHHEDFDIDQISADASQYEVADKKYVREICVRKRIDLLIQNAAARLKGNTEYDFVSEVNQKSDEIRNWMKENPLASWSQFDGKYKELLDVVNKRGNLVEPRPLLYEDVE